MVKRPKWIRVYNDRHGKRRTEFRRKGFKTYSLREPIGSIEFREDYNAALRGDVPPGVLLKYGDRPTPLPNAKPQSLRWLVEQYKGSAAYRTLEQSTRTVRSNILDTICLEHGDKPYTGLQTVHVKKMRDVKADKPESANAWIKALRQVYAYAVDYEFCDRNPVESGLYLQSKNPDGHHAWTFEEVEQFEEAHPVGTKARLAIALMLYAGCPRSSDTHRLGRQHITKDDRLQYTQHKGRHSMSPSHIDIQVIPELRRIIDASPTGDLTFIVNQWGNAFTVKGFYNWFKKRCREAGLPHCSPHGMRKAAAARMAELGLSDFEIMANGGWKTLKEVQRYTKGARKRVLADRVSETVQADIERTKVSNHSGNGK